MPFCLIFLLFSLVSCSTPKQGDEEKQRLIQLNKNSVIHSKEFWEKLTTGKSLTDKFLVMPTELKEYIKRDNKIYGFPSSINVYHSSNTEKADVIEALKEIPAHIAKPINERLLGIFFAKDLGGSALTDEVKDRKTGKSLHKGFVVLDMQQLNRKANEWCTWKESSPFPKGDYQLKCTIANPQENTRIVALSYILLHELAHILNINQKDIPFWSYNEVTDDHINHSSFTQMSWQQKNRKLQSLYDQEFPLRTATKYYTKKSKLKNSDMIKLYQGIQKTNFPTGYAMNNPWDDFAETFVNYIHTQVYKRPFKISIVKRGKEVLSYQHCWKDKRCQQKRQFIQKFLAQY